MFARHWIFKNGGITGFWVEPTGSPRNKPRHLLLRSSKSHWWPGGWIKCVKDRNGYKSYWFTVCNVKNTKIKLNIFHSISMRFLEKHQICMFLLGGCVFFINFHLWSLTSRSSPISATRGLWSHVSWRRHRHESNDPELSGNFGEAHVRVDAWLTWKQL